MPDTYVEIDLDALKHNAETLTKKYNCYDHFIGVVKGDAYGHGMKAAEALFAGGVKLFAVSSLEEAKKLRQHTKADILLLQPAAVSRLDEAATLDLLLGVGDKDYLDQVISYKEKYQFRIHLQIDCGFNRLGFKSADEVDTAIRKIKESGLTVAGVYQHFATAGIFDPYFDRQIQRFRELTTNVDLSEIPMVHLGSGVALLSHPKIDVANTTRMGLVMYGYNVAPLSYGSGPKDKLRAMRDKYYQKKWDLTETYRDVALDLIPAMTAKTRVIAVKDVKAGEHIGYNASYTVGEDIRVAILPAGYNNGLGHQNNDRVVEIGGRLFPVVGEMGMNMCAVKVDRDVKVDDEVILLGSKISLGRFSRASGLGLAEALLNLGKNNERFYIKNGKRI